jgi:hypothetical protein
VDSALCCELTRIKSGPLRQLFELDQRSAAPVPATCGLKVQGRRRTRDRRRRGVVRPRVGTLPDRNSGPHKQGGEKLTHFQETRASLSSARRGEAWASSETPRRFRRGAVGRCDSFFGLHLSFWRKSIFIYW